MRILMLLGSWFGLSIYGVVMFAVGAAVGRRRAWEEGRAAGYAMALQATHASAAVPDVGDLRVEHHLDEGVEQEARAR